MENLFRTTLDVDTNDKEKISKIFWKILECKHLLSLYMKPSLLKGVHFSLICDIKCEICRFCYDDDRRYAYDNFRNDYERNVLFDGREKIT